MDIKEFQEKLIAIYSATFNDGAPEHEWDGNSKTCYHFFIHFFKTAHKGKTFFEEAPMAGGVSFYLKEISDKPFVLTEEALVQEDPELFITDKGKMIAANANVSTVLLTEYAFWISQQDIPQYKMRFKGYGIYNQLRENWTLIFNPTNYPNKIWLGKENDSVILILNEVKEIICMAKTNDVIEEAKKKLK